MRRQAPPPPRAWLHPLLVAGAGGAVRLRAWRRRIEALGLGLAVLTEPAAERVTHAVVPDHLLAPPGRHLGELARHDADVGRLLASRPRGGRWPELAHAIWLQDCITEGRVLPLPQERGGAVAAAPPAGGAGAAVPAAPAAAPAAASPSPAVAESPMGPPKSPEAADGASASAATAAAAAAEEAAVLAAISGARLDEPPPSPERRFVTFSAQGGVATGAAFPLRAVSVNLAGGGAARWPRLRARLEAHGADILMLQGLDSEQFSRDALSPWLSARGYGFAVGPGGAPAAGCMLAWRTAALDAREAAAPRLRDAVALVAASDAGAGGEAARALWQQLAARDEGCAFALLRHRASGVRLLAASALLASDAALPDVAAAQAHVLCALLAAALLRHGHGPSDVGRVPLLLGGGFGASSRAPEGCLSGALALLAQGELGPGHPQHPAAWRQQPDLRRLRLGAAGLRLASAYPLHAPPATLPIDESAVAGDALWFTSRAATLVERLEAAGGNGGAAAAGVHPTLGCTLIVRGDVEWGGRGVGTGSSVSQC